MTTIPSDLFDGMSGITSLQYAFQDSAITTIPAGLLDDVTSSATVFDSMFKGCTSLTALPADLILYCTAVDYDYMFSGCTSMTSGDGTDFIERALTNNASAHGTDCFLNSNLPDQADIVSTYPTWQ